MDALEVSVAFGARSEDFLISADCFPKPLSFSNSRTSVLSVRASRSLSAAFVLVATVFWAIRVSNSVIL